MIYMIIRTKFLKLYVFIFICYLFYVKINLCIKYIENYVIIYDIVCMFVALCAQPIII